MAYLADKLQETYAPANIHSFKKKKNELIEAVKSFTARRYGGFKGK